jgi:hypothetical protein
MDWENFERMDPHLLVGVVNTEIRNRCGSLKELCLTHDIAREVLTAKLAEAGYDFLEEQQQFR